MWRSTETLPDTWVIKSHTCKFYWCTSFFGLTPQQTSTREHQKCLPLLAKMIEKAAPLSRLNTLKSNIRFVLNNKAINHRYYFLMFMVPQQHHCGLSVTQQWENLKNLVEHHLWELWEMYDVTVDCCEPAISLIGHLWEWGREVDDRRSLPTRPVCSHIVDVMQNYVLQFFSWKDMRQTKAV